MSESPEARIPDGVQEAQSVELGDPARVDDEPTRGSLDERPDLDRREERISSTRKPMGPPLEPGAASPDATRGSGSTESTEGPTDPL